MDETAVFTPLGELHVITVVGVFELLYPYGLEDAWVTGWRLVSPGLFEPCALSDGGTPVGYDGPEEVNNLAIVKVDEETL